MDLDTFLTTLYVLVDNWYKAHISLGMRRCVGAKPHMSDSEVLTVAIAGQWQVGVPWRSERGVVRYMQQHGQGWFPTMLQRSAFNERVHKLWGAFIQLQQIAAGQLTTHQDIYSCVDCEPVPACSLAQASQQRHHWLWLSRLGRGGTEGRWFYGDKLLAVVTASGVITGWLLGSAAVNDRWLLDLLLSVRADVEPIWEHVASTHQSRRVRPSQPEGYLRGRCAAGHSSPHPYLADRNFNGRHWARHWRVDYGAYVLSVPPANTPEAWSRSRQRCLASHRQIIDTVFARLDQVFGMKHVNAHSYEGQLARVAAKIAAYTLGLLINRLVGRPLGALETLLC